MAVLPKVVYRFSATSMKITASSSVETEKLILKFMWKDLLGGSAVSTPHFQCRGQVGSQIPQAILHGQKKKKNSRRNAKNLKTQNNLENEEQSWKTYTS